MTKLLSSLFLALTITACAAETPEDPTDTEENLGTASSELKWTPLPDGWKDCVVNGQICRCSGDVVDCRTPKPIPPKTISLIAR